jgi:hypothetical protein
MAGLESLDTSLTQDIEDMQIQEFKIIQTSKKRLYFVRWFLFQSYA